MRCELSLALFIGFACCYGCQKQDESTIRIKPTSFDFGVIAASGQEISAVIDLRNTGSSAAQIELVATCGCINCKEDRFSLKAGECRQIPFTFSSSGKSGEFRAEIGVVCNGIIQKIPLKIVFEPEVFVFPSRVVLLPSSDDKLIGEFRLEATESLMPNLRLIIDEDEIELDEIELEGLELPDPLHTRYRVITAAPSRRIYAPIRVMIESQETPVLNIPVISAAP